MGSGSDAVTSSRTMVFLFRYGAGEHVDFMPAFPALCRQLSEKGWTVEHLGCKSSLEPPEELLASCTVRSLPLRVRRGSSFDKTLKALLWLFLLPWIGWRLQRRGVQTVFVDETLPLSVGLLRLGYKGRLCVTIHDFFTQIYIARSPLLAGVGRWIERKDARDRKKIDLLFPRVEAAREFLLSEGVAVERIHVIPDSVDTTRFSPGEGAGFRSQWGISPEEVVLIHHGILHTNKGNLLLIEAMGRLCKDTPSLRLVLIGDGLEMKPLRAAVERLGLKEKVVLTGWLPGLQDIAEALREADIGLVMRRGIEGDDFHVTSTLVHNLASGLPVLAARLKGLESSLNDGEQGLFFDPGCGEEFDAAVRKLVNDPDLRESMGTHARAWAMERFDRERIAQAYVHCLEDSTNPPMNPTIDP